ncbi:hypothetical protein ASPVEDRAFT_36219 [Aspergillus versicolor CBS 583.65]|uniref:25S rRNA (Uridine(2843)-N(3))-methyltransferase n=1 Tax=Aspergillus versicolor CBS 583.65 TaxID=1036611 RepID=A0A1L9P5M0_ASPVE|nr:uncharacterized protein ASPVEDRAFT_36219 [Aspergillus versicolor CBS 583.65]OJI96831.1 hypothetical protein ASPVEDRAFT_36219 [Aspergillus versicolor CBS 583.65]
MAPPKSNSSRKHAKDDGKRSEKKPLPRRQVQGQNRPQRQQNDTGAESQTENQIDISDSIPIALQQLLLNVFKSALLSSPNLSSESQDPATEEPLDIKALIQTIKGHLYNRDFDSAFADADEGLLRAYALRWSAARALGYAGLFKSMFRVLMEKEARNSGKGSALQPTHVVCIGGGAGAELVALSAAWRDLMDEGTIPGSQKGLSDALEAVSLSDGQDDQGDESTGKPEQSQTPSPSSSSLSITAVDIADWSAVVRRLSSTILSPSVPSSKSYPSPLFANVQQQDTTTDAKLNVDFKRLDVLSLSDAELASLFHTTQQFSSTRTNMVTLMFTLNELFSTSMPKATAFLLKITDLLQPGTLLLVVDSPGSYSTLKLSKGGSAGAQERQYPMKFLLDHALLSVAKGSWERVYSQDSRWWRRDAARLWYDVGEGAGLEDMRFQVHVYRRL